jgi:RNA polymerase sigma factor (sigma-70 family)
MGDDEFADFLEALRQRDPQAFRRFNELYGPDIRALIRSRLKGAGLGGVVESGDVWQSILVKFVQRVQNRQFKAETFADLRSYLRTAAFHKLRDLIRRAQADKRSPPDVPPGQPPSSVNEVADPGFTPSRQVAYAELLQKILSQLSPEDRQVFQWRLQGWSWPQIAAKRGGLPATLRIHFNREIQRVLREMNL